MPLGPTAPEPTAPAGPWAVGVAWLVSSDTVGTAVWVGGAGVGGGPNAGIGADACVPEATGL
eukprot:3076897-Pleurochrysis_carterae.AAC.1